jgi:periplasmic glucans biosynthesis protein
VLVCWEPSEAPKIGQPYRLGYRIHWLPEMSIPGRSKVLSSRRTQQFSPPAEKRPDTVQFYIDYAQTAQVLEDPKLMALTVDVTEGAKLLEKQVEMNPDTGGWRAIFRVQVAPDTASFMANCRLLTEGRLASERWTYQWKR